MRNRGLNLHVLRAFLRRHWIAAVAALFVAVLITGTPTWAAPVPRPHNQTVPRPTPTSSGDPVATATPRPDDDGGSGTVGDPGDAEPLEPVDPSDLFSQDPAGAAPGGEAPGGTAELTAGIAVAALNVRGGPGTGFPVLGGLSTADQVTVLARNQDGTWWYICCLPGTTTAGWASAELMVPNFNRADANALLPVTDENTPPPAAAPAPAQTPRPALPMADEPLILDFQMAPPFVWQGETAEIEMRVTNPNAVDVSTVALSDELPEGLTLVSTQADAGGVVETVTTDAGRTLLIVRWSTIPAGTSAAATLVVQVGEDLPDGAVVDNLVAVRAANAGYSSGALTIGMPPVEPPRFD